MPNIQPVNVNRHGSRRWLRPANYSFAAQLPVVNISATEMHRACVTVPIAFVKNGEAWATCALLGVPPSTNLCVLPDGRWVGPFVPAALRAHPFSLHMAKEGGQVVLCIDEDVGLAGEDAAQGEPFFAEDKQPVPLVKQTMEFLTQWHGGRIALERACALLDKHKLIVPWTFNLKYQDNERTVGGLFRVDEKALAKLGGDALQELMQSGAMALAYAQLISVQHLAKLAEWSKLHSLAPPKAPAAAPVTDPGAPFQVPASLATPGGDLNLDFLNRK